MSMSISPTECFLRYITLPEAEDTPVDLRQTAVVIMSHLDRLATPFMPPTSTNTGHKMPGTGSTQEVLGWGWLAWTGANSPNSSGYTCDMLGELRLIFTCLLYASRCQEQAMPGTGSTQEVLGWGWLAWTGANSPNSSGHTCEMLGELGVLQLACAERCLIALTKTGRVYMCFYSSESQGPQLMESLADKEVLKVAAHPEGKHYMALTSEGEVYSWGNGDGGRLGHGDTNVCYKGQKVLVIVYPYHPEGKHYMALTSEGEVYSWGNGDGGRLGHGDTNSREEPTLVRGLSGKQLGRHVVHIVCGSTYSAAITADGELFTWGRGNYGRLGHGSSEDQLTPTLVVSLKGRRVIDICCGSGDAQTLAVTDDGTVWSWGDGDYGKLGRGGSDGCKTPKIIDRLQGQDIVRVCCGAQFSLALTKTGHIWTWGKGDSQRLGHGTEEHIRFPKQLEGLRGKKVVDVAVGSMHCLVMTEEGEVYGWGRNDQGQLGDSSFSTKSDPTLMPLDGKSISGIACGPAQSFCWTSTGHWSVGLRVPFVVDVCHGTFQHLDQLLQRVCEGLDGRSDWPPPQEKECMAVAGLNLLRLQLHAAITQNEDPARLNLQPGSPLLNSLKQRVVELASNTGVLGTVQTAAQATLQSGWLLLLPTAEERARALSALLPSDASGDGASMTPGRRFMMDLLVSSLMADGGLESALAAAIKTEMQEIEGMKEKELERHQDEREEDTSATAGKTEEKAKKVEADIRRVRSSGSTIPLLQLMQQLLRNVSSQTLMRLKEFAHDVNRVNGYQFSGVEEKGNVSSQTLMRLKEFAHDVNRVNGNVSSQTLMRLKEFAHDVNRVNGYQFTGVEEKGNVSSQTLMRLKEFAHDVNRVNGNVSSQTLMRLKEFAHDVNRVNGNVSSQTLMRLKEFAHDVNRVNGYQFSGVEEKGKSPSQDLLLRFQRLLVGKLFPMEEARDKAGVEEIAFDGQRNLWVVGSTDSAEFAVQYNKQGKVLRKFDLQKTGWLRGVAVDTRRNRILITQTTGDEESPHGEVLVFSPEGTLVRTVGWQQGMKSPQFLAVDGKGRILVSDFGSHCVFGYSEGGDFLFKFGGYGRNDGQLSDPRGICTDRAGNIIVADSGNNRVEMFDKTGRFLKHIASDMKDPHAVAMAPQGQLVVTRHR
uniref:Uncharacterized protein n=1 Tax=Branchiostoma floridae TaxID=7739 RepID=C3XXA1_BRAFL|eukprot:XP_002611351.1 hypothetical protein BRAFLDRAFT_73256 [Branchiostoma floridae]